MKMVVDAGDVLYNLAPGARAAKVRCDEQVTRTESGVTPLMVP
jgi:hypothetical protein